MSGGKEVRYARVAAQVDRLRRLYSWIGEPLSADVIIDLHRHLASALEAEDERRKCFRRSAKRRMNA